MGNLFPQYVSIQFAGFKMFGALMLFLIGFIVAYFAGPDSWIKVAIIFAFYSSLMLVIMRLAGDEWAWTWLKEWEDKNYRPYLVGYVLKEDCLKSYVSKNQTELMNKCDYADALVILSLEKDFGFFITFKDGVIQRAYDVKNVSRRDNIPHIVIIDDPGIYGNCKNDFRISLPIDLALEKADMFNYGIREFLNSLPQSTCKREEKLKERMQEAIDCINTSSRKTQTMHKIREGLEGALEKWSDEIKTDSLIWQECERF